MSRYLPPPSPRRGNGGYDSSSSYRPSYQSYPPPPPPNSYKPPPPAAPPPSSSGPFPPQWKDARVNDARYDYNRRSDYDYRGPYSGLRRQSNHDLPRDGRDERDGRDRDFRPPQADFSFRVDRPAGVEDSYESYRFNGRGNDGFDRDRRSRANQKDRSDSYRPRRDENTRSGPNRGPNFNQRRGPPPPRLPRKAADRDFLHRKHGDHVEAMLGDVSARPTYRPLDELSDDDEADMDISGEESTDEGRQPATKRARLSATTTDTEQSAPRWSNPDPYTALPPPDETARKKRDVVQLIRKARVEAASQKSAQASETADFISCDFSDESDAAVGKNGATKNPVLNAPTGPRGVSSLPPRPPVQIPSSHNANEHGGQNNRSITTQPKSDSASTKGKKPVDLTPSLSLGNRKRTIDDRIKHPHASLKKVTKMPGDGSINPDWRPVKNAPEGSHSPWAKMDHSSISNMGVRLHHEIVDFYEYVRPRDFEERIRHQLVDELNYLIKGKWRDATVMPFGSFKSGLYLPIADMDLVICSESMIKYRRPKYGSKKDIFQLRSFLKGRHVAYNDDIEAITGAKVPLLKFCDNSTGLKIDISFEKLDGVNAIQTFLDWKRKYPAMPVLVSVIKQFLCMRGLNEPVNGGIGGFTVICLVVNLLNHNPKVQSGTMVPEHHLGELLVEFFEFYGKLFNYAETAIRMNPPGMINKTDIGQTYKNRDRLCIIDPNNPDNDIAGGSKNYSVIVDHFRRAYLTLSSRMITLNRRGGTLDGYNTILGPLLAGNYSWFKTQREYMRALDQDKKEKANQPAIDYYDPQVVFERQA